MTRQTETPTAEPKATPQVFNPRQLYSTKDAAAGCNLTARYFEMLRQQGGGPTYMRFGRAVRYSGNALNQWLATCQATNTAQERGR